MILLAAYLPPLREGCIKLDTSFPLTLVSVPIDALAILNGW